MFGQLGRDRGPEPRRVDVGRGVRFVRVACGAGHTLALAGGGAVFSFGLGAFGATGHGDRADRHAPCCVEGLRVVGATHVSAGENHSAALSAGGEVYVWGRGEHGQIGRGEAPSEPAPDALVPARVSALVDANITCAQIACGGDHALALTTRGVVLAWGRGSSGPAGRGETEDVRTPTRVDPALFRGERVVHVSAGRAHNVAVGESGTVYTWGDGSRGQLAHRDESGTVCVGAIRGLAVPARTVPARTVRGHRPSREWRPSRDFLADATYASPSPRGITPSPFSDRRPFERRRREARREWVSNRRRRFAAFRIVDGVSRRDRRHFRRRFRRSSNSPNASPRHASVPWTRDELGTSS